MVGLCLYLLVRQQRRRPAGHERSLPREPAKCHLSASEGGILRLSRHAERHARHPHHRTLELPGENSQNRLRRREPLRRGRAVRKREIGGHQFDADRRLHLRFPRHQVLARHDQGGGDRQWNRCLRTRDHDRREPEKPKLTPIISPDGFRADGADVALFDVEVIDAVGRRYPDREEARVDFKLEGPGHLRGGYNSGKVNSINNLWLDTECGTNRVAIRSTRVPGKDHVTAARDGFEPAAATIE